MTRTALQLGWETNSSAACADAAPPRSLRCLQVARGYMHLLHGALGMLGLMLPLADYPVASASPTVECK